MTDRECVAFLQWALPVMRMRWRGFRRVRGQVCKRISRRIDTLGLPGVVGYQTYLEANPDEWRTLAALCRITISRFYRDRGVFDYVGNVLLPRLDQRGEADVACWSVGCASAEEAYTMQILWKLRGAPAMVRKALHVLATDSDPVMLERARKAAYPASALKDLPSDLTTHAFQRSGNMFVLRARFKEHVHFEEQDICESMPPGPFDIILCRNLVFTYFEETLQREILGKLAARLRGDGFLVSGAQESLPANDLGLTAEAPAIYKRTRPCLSPPDHE
jgi:chemotaxis protein methyltransferase CheR